MSGTSEASRGHILLRIRLRILLRILLKILLRILLRICGIVGRICRVLGVGVENRIGGVVGGIDDGVVRAVAWVSRSIVVVGVVIGAIGVAIGVLIVIVLSVLSICCWVSYRGGLDLTGRGHDHTVVWGTQHRVWTICTIECVRLAHPTSRWVVVVQWVTIQRCKALFDIPFGHRSADGAVLGLGRALKTGLEGRVGRNPLAKLGA